MLNSLFWRNWPCSGESVLESTRTWHPWTTRAKVGIVVVFFGSGFQMFFFYNPLLIPLLSAIGLLALPMHCRVADQVASFQDVVAHRSCWLVFQYIFVGSLEMEASNWLSHFSGLKTQRKAIIAIRLVHEIVRELNLRKDGRGKVAQMRQQRFMLEKLSKLAVQAWDILGWPSKLVKKTRWSSSAHPKGYWTKNACTMGLQFPSIFHTSVHSSSILFIFFHPANPMKSVCHAPLHGQVPLLLTHFGVAYPPDEATVRRIFGARAPPMRPLAEVGCMERMPEFQPSAYEPWNNWNGMGLEGLDSWPVGFWELYLQYQPASIACNKLDVLDLRVCLRAQLHAYISIQCLSKEVGKKPSELPKTGIAITIHLLT